MSDLVSGIKQIGPAYPVRPAQPSQKDREPGQRNNKRQRPGKESDSDAAVADDESPRTIDEHI